MTDTTNQIVIFSSLAFAQATRRAPCSKGALDIGPCKIAPDVK
jgi:hypothetical protein